MTRPDTSEADVVSAQSRAAEDAVVIRQASLPIDDPARPLNDSALPSVMVWAGGEAYDDLTMPGVASRGLDLDSCALAVGIYRAMSEAGMKDAALASPAAVPESVRGSFEQIVSQAFRDYDSTSQGCAIDDPQNTYVRGLRNIIVERLAALAATPSRRADTPLGGGGVVPEGWRLVPRNLTFEMAAAFSRHFGKVDPQVLSAALQSLLAAAPAAPEPAAGGEREIADPELSTLAEAASVPERAYGILWRLTAFDTGRSGYAHDARKVLLASMDKEGQRRGIAWATRHYGPLGPNPRFMLSDEDRMEMGL